MRATLRGARLIVHLVAGLALVSAVTLLPWLGRHRETLSRWWNRELLKVLKIRLKIHGKPMAGGHIIACNHVSWLDISLLASVEVTRFVSKYEVHEWPIAGWLANAAGTFYIRRGAGGTKPLVREMGAYLAGGRRRSITFFPEGTTTEGSLVLKFQPRLFAAAIENNVPVQPVALRYARAENGENIAAFIGDDDLVHNLLRLLKEPSLDVELNYCDPISPVGLDRAQLAQAAHAAVAGVIAPKSLLPVSEAEEEEIRESLAA